MHNALMMGVGNAATMFVIQYVTGPAKQGMWAQTAPYCIAGHISVVEQNIFIL